MFSKDHDRFAASGNRRIFIFPISELVLVPIAFIGIYLGQRAFGLDAQFRLAGANPFFGAYVWFAMVAIKVFHNNLLGEEVGWSGFALPRMQQCFSPLVASLILGAIWAVWHYPLWTMQGMDMAAVLMLSIVVLPLSIIHSWFWNRSGGSIWVVSLLPQSTLMQLAIFSSIALVLVMIDCMWRRLESK